MSNPTEAGITSVDIPVMDPGYTQTAYHPNNAAIVDRQPHAVPMKVPRGTLIRRLNRRLRNQKLYLGAGHLRNHEGLTASLSLLCGLWSTNEHKVYALDVPAEAVAKFITENLEYFNISEGKDARLPFMTYDPIYQRYVPRPVDSEHHIPKRSRLGDLLDDSDSDDEVGGPHDG